METGRYSRPQIPLNERFCKFCNTNSVENEIHFLMLCPLYSDIRYELFQKALEFINNFNMMNVENKFIELMNCDKIQIIFSLDTFIYSVIYHVFIYVFLILFTIDNLRYFSIMKADFKVLVF